MAEGLTSSDRGTPHIDAAADSVTAGDIRTQAREALSWTHTGPAGVFRKIPDEWEVDREVMRRQQERIAQLETALKQQYAIGHDVACAWADRTRYKHLGQRLEAERDQWEDRAFRAAEEGREQFDEGAEAMRNEIAAHLKAWEVAAGDKFLLTWQGVRNEIYTAPTPLPPEAQQGGNSSH
jgi:hypothetical protein